MVNTPSTVMMSVRTPRRKASSRHGASATALFASDRELQGRVPHACDSDEVPLCRRWDSRVVGPAHVGAATSCGNFCPTALGVGGLRYEQRPVLAQEVNRAARAEVDGSIELLEIFEVDELP